MDMSKLSTEDLQAISAGDMTRVSTAGLQYLATGQMPAAPETTIKGNIKEAVKGVIPGAVNLLRTAGIGASALLPEEQEKSARATMNSLADSATQRFAPAPGYEDSVGRNIGQGLGSLLAVAPLAMAGPAGIGAGIGVGLAAGAGEARERAEASGATADQRGTATALGTIPGGFDTAIDMALTAMPGGMGKALTVVKRALLSGGIEGATEAAQKIAQNLIAQGIYKPDQSLIEGSGEEGAYGAGVGAIASVLLDMAIPGRRMASAPKPVPPKATEETPPGPPTAEQKLALGVQYDEALKRKEELIAQANTFKGSKDPADQLLHKQAKEAVREYEINTLRPLTEQYAPFKAEVAAMRAKTEAPAAPAAPAAPTMPDGTPIPTSPFEVERAYKASLQGYAAATQRVAELSRAGKFDEAEQAEKEAYRLASESRALQPHLPKATPSPKITPLSELQERLTQLQGSMSAKGKPVDGLYTKAVRAAASGPEAARADAQAIAAQYRNEMRELQQKIAVAQREEATLQQRQEDLLQQKPMPDPVNPMAEFQADTDVIQEDRPQRMQTEAFARDIAGMEAARMDTAVTRQRPLFEDPATTPTQPLTSQRRYGTVKTEEEYRADLDNAQRARATARATGNRAAEAAAKRAGDSAIEGLHSLSDEAKRQGTNADTLGGSQGARDMQRTMAELATGEVGPQLPDSEIIPEPGTPTVESLQKQLAQLPATAQEQNNNVLSRLQDNLQAVAADPERAAQVSDWLYGLRTGAGRSQDIGGMLDTLDAGKMSETEQLLEARGVPLTEEQKQALKGTQDRRNRENTPTIVPTGATATGVQTEFDLPATRSQTAGLEGPVAPKATEAGRFSQIETSPRVTDVGTRFNTPAEFLANQESDTLAALKESQGSRLPTIQRATKQVAPIVARIEQLAKNAAAEREKFEFVKARTTMTDSPRLPFAMATPEVEQIHKRAQERLDTVLAKHEQELAPFLEQRNDLLSQLRTVLNYSFGLAERADTNQHLFGKTRREMKESLGAVRRAQSHLEQLTGAPATKANWDKMRRLYKDVVETARADTGRLLADHVANSPQFKQQFDKFKSMQNMLSTSLDKEMAAFGDITEQLYAAETALRDNPDFNRLRANQKRRLSLQQAEAEVKVAKGMVDRSQKEAAAEGRRIGKFTEPLVKSQREQATRLQKQAESRTQAADSAVHIAQTERDAIMNPVMEAQAKRTAPATKEESHSDAEKRMRAERVKETESADRLRKLERRTVSFAQQEEWKHSLEKWQETLREQQALLSHPEAMAIAGVKKASVVTMRDRAIREIKELRSKIYGTVAVEQAEARVAKLEGEGEGGIGEPGINERTLKSRTKKLEKARKDLETAYAAPPTRTGYTINGIPKETEQDAPAPRGPLTKDEKTAAQARAAEVLTEQEAAVVKEWVAAEEALEDAKHEGNNRKIAYLNQKIALLTKGTLPPRKVGPLVKPVVNAGDMRTGTRESKDGVLRTGSTAKATQAGNIRGVTSKQAQRAGNKFAKGFDTVVTPEEAVRNAKDALGAARDALVRKMRDLEDKHAKMLPGRTQAQIDNASADAKEDVKRAREHVIQLQQELDAAEQAAKGAPAESVVEARVKEEAAKDREAAAAAKAAPKLTEAEQAALQDELDAEMRKEDAASIPDDGRTTTPLSAEGMALAEDGQIINLLEHIAKTSTSPERRAQAKALAKLVLRTKLRVEDGLMLDGKPAAGLYAPKTNTVTLDRKAMSEEDFIHEVYHAATDSTLLATPDTLTPRQRQARKEIEGMYEALRNNPAFKDVHAAASAREFVAEVKTNDALRAQLQATGKPTTLWQRLVNAVKRLLKMDDVSKADRLIEDMLQPSRIMKAAATPSLLRKPAATLPADLTDLGKYVHDERTALDKAKELKGSALLAFRQAAADMRASLRETFTFGDAAKGSALDALVSQRDSIMNLTQAVAERGSMAMSKDAKGNVVVNSGHSDSLKDVLEAVAELPVDVDATEKVNLYQRYRVARRAQSVGWDKMQFKEEERADAKAAGLRLLAAVEADPELKAALKVADKHYDSLNKGLLKFLDQTHALPQDIIDKLMKDPDYVPYYRVNGDTVEALLPDGNFRSVGDIRTQPFLQELVGGEQKLMNFTESVMRNIATLTSLGMDNLVSKEVAYHLQDIAKGTKKMVIQRNKGAASQDIVRFHQKPDPNVPGDDGWRHIKIDTEGTVLKDIPTTLLVQSLAGSYGTMSMLEKAGSVAAQYLRSGVTRNPLYILRQLIRDPLHASITGNTHASPLVAVMQSFRNFAEIVAGNSKESDLLQKYGVTHSNIFSGDSSDYTKMGRMLAGDQQGWWDRVKRKADMYAAAADAATRVQVYKDSMAAGSTETQAVHAARELMNFNRRGSSQSVHFLSHVIPFFNAQIQGLDLLYRSANGKMPAQELFDTKQKFFNRAMSMAALSFMYAAMMEDDPEWASQTLYQKMAAISVPNIFNEEGENLKLPTPFETGLLFFSLPVAIMQHMKRDFSREDMAVVGSMFANQLPGGSLIPIPQIAKGALDVYRNYNSLTGLPIESAGQKRLDPDQRYTERTTEIAKEFSSILNAAGVRLSPIQMEYLSNAYLGQLPLAVAGIVDMLFDDETLAEKPTKGLNEWPLIGTMFSPAIGSDASSHAYEKAQAAVMKRDTLRFMLSSGQREEALQYRDAHRVEIAAAPAADAFMKRMSEVSQHMKAVRAAPRDSMTADEKKAQIARIKKLREQRGAKFLEGYREMEERAEQSGALQ